MTKDNTDVVFLDDGECLTKHFDYCPCNILWKNPNELLANPINRLLDLIFTVLPGL